MKALFAVVFLLAQAVVGFRLVSPAVSPRTVVSAKPQEKKPSAWDKYTEGEYGKVCRVYVARTSLAPGLQVPLGRRRPGLR